MDAPDRTPWGPWTDYGRSQGAAEDAVGAVIETILSDGGLLLWQRYLERKAFVFASSSISEALVSQLIMHFVPHDEGEPLSDGWVIEDEPEPNSIDSWARMHLPVRRLPRNDESAAQGKDTSKWRVSSSDSRRQQMKARSSDSRGKIPAGKSGRNDKSESRSSGIPDDSVLDEAEERLREAKAQEEARRREKEKRLKESEKTKEEERKKVQQLHEEMAKRAHTFDTEGNLIWVEELKLERLPKVQEVFGFAVKKDLKVSGREFDGTKSSVGLSAPPSPESPKSQNKRAGLRKSQTLGDKQDRKHHDHSEFSDFFSKLQHGQPPILETMAVQPGVSLESMGKRKAGPVDVHSADHHMSRREYVQLAEQELAMDGNGRSPVSAAMMAEARSAQQNSSWSSPTRANDSRLEENPSTGGAAADGPGANGGGASLPPVPMGRSASAVALGGGGTGYPAGGGRSAQKPPTQSGEKTTAQHDPPAPSPATRNRKFEAVGHLGRPPRYHAPRLGAPFGMGSAQPPLGATMGHGLIRHGSLKEAYFFPSPTPDLPLSMLRRASSEMVVSPGGGNGSARKPPTPGRARPREPNPDAGPEPDSEGKLKPEMTPAYRHFRQSLLPGGDSTYGRF